MAEQAQPEESRQECVAWSFVLGRAHERADRLVGPRSPSRVDSTTTRSRASTVLVPRRASAVDATSVVLRLQRSVPPTTHVAKFEDGRASSSGGLDAGLRGLRSSRTSRRKGWSKTRRGVASRTRATASRRRRRGLAGRVDVVLAVVVVVGASVEVVPSWVPTSSPRRRRAGRRPLVRRRGSSGRPRRGRRLLVENC